MKVREIERIKKEGQWYNKSMKREREMGGPETKQERKQWNNGIADLELCCIDFIVCFPFLSGQMAYCNCFYCTCSLQLFRTCASCIACVELRVSVCDCARPCSCGPPPHCPGDKSSLVRFRVEVLSDEKRQHFQFWPNFIAQMPEKCWCGFAPKFWEPFRGLLLKKLFLQPQALFNGPKLQK